MLLREYVQLLEPKIVIWAYFAGNDVCEMRRVIDCPSCRSVESERTFYAEEYNRYIGDKTFKIGLMDMRDEIDDLLRKEAKNLQDAEEKKQEVTINKIRDFAKDMLFLRSLRAAYDFYPRRLVKQLCYVSHDEVRDYLVPGLLSGVSSFRDSVESWGGQLIVVYLTRWDETSKGITNRDNHPELIEKIKEIAAPHFIDTRPLFLSHPNPASLYGRGDPVGDHLNKEGYRLVGELIADYIEDNNLVRN